jgi:hypothetical protein
MARGLFRSRADRVWRGSQGSFRMDTLLYFKLIGDGVHFEGFIKKAKCQEELESGQGGGR